MRVYNKRNFASGLVLALLGAGLLAIGLSRGFELKKCVLSVLCLFIGYGLIIRSISRQWAKEDLLNERDERNQLIALKSRSRSLGLTQGISFGLMILFFLTAKSTGSELLISCGIGLGFGLAVSMIAELCATLYYEHQN